MTLFPLSGNDLFYRIEEWDDAGSKPVRVLAAACNHSIALGAFHAAVREYKHRRLTMREGIKVNREHVPEGLFVPEKIEDILSRYGIPRDYWTVEGIPAASSPDNLPRVAITPLNGLPVYHDLGAITKLIDELKACSTPEYAAQFEKALEAAKHV